ncbi:MAG: cupin domain-containing protein [Oscillospiraceae bacterium]|jgi:uncharacterized cupin superfamily protein|nr:cupin domain-containing protein [Oscillospiraceae bacterium]
MDEILHLRPEDVPRKHKSDHEGYEYDRRDLLPRGRARCVASLYEIPPGKAAYPYHCHAQNEECFYILGGSGILRTPTGEREIKAGEFLFFPAGERGAHKLTNTGDAGLVYLDYDTTHEIDVAFYPDSGKIGVWGMGINQVYRTEDQVGYYEGE